MRFILPTTRFATILTSLAMASCQATSLGPTSSPIGPSPVPRTPTKTVSSSIATVLARWATDEVLRTPTPSRPTAIPHPTETPEPPRASDAIPLELPTGAPLLAYIRFTRTGNLLALLDPAEERVFTHLFPHDEILPWPPIRGLSPDGHYFARYHGALIDYPDFGCVARACALALASVFHAFEIDVLDLHTGQSAFIQRLVSPAYPSDLDDLATQYVDMYDHLEPTQAMRSAVYDSDDALLHGFLTAEWSPDSTVLAYASQQPGPSSDLYFFSPRTGQARRVTYDPEHLQEVSWAPDSSAVVALSTDFRYHGTLETSRIFSRDGVPQLTTSAGYFTGWANPAWILITYAVDFDDEYSGLRGVRVSDGYTIDLWHESYMSYAVKPDLSSTIVGREVPRSDESLAPGLFRAVRKTRSVTQLAEEPAWDVAYWGSEEFDFAATNRDEGTIAVRPDGSWIRLDPLPRKLEASPSGRYLALYGYGESGKYDQILLPASAGLQILDDQGHVIATPYEGSVDCMMWSPDSTALAFQANDRLYYWHEGEDAAKPIDRGLGYWCQFRWVDA